MKKGAIIIEGHVQGLSNTRTLGKQGIPVFVVNRESRCLARHSRYCTRFFTCPPYESDDLADFLMNLADAYGLDEWMILPSNDHAVMTLSRNKEKLSQHFRVLAPEMPLMNILYDKLLLVRFAEERGLEIPRTWLPTEPMPDQAGFPVLAKGRHGLSFYRETGTKAFICPSAEAYQDFLASRRTQTFASGMMVQELISDGEENYTISVGAYCRKGEVMATWTGMKVRQHPIRFGTATLAKGVSIPDAETYAISLLQHLRYDGICEVELLRDPRDQKLKLIEINPRTWLWVGLARASGVDLVTMAWSDTMGEKITPPAFRTEGLIWRNFYTDIYFGLKAMLKGQISLRQYFKGMKGKKVPAVWDKDDAAPFLHLTAMLPFLIRNR